MYAQITAFALSMHIHTCFQRPIATKTLQDIASLKQNAGLIRPTKLPGMPHSLPSSRKKIVSAIQKIGTTAEVPAEEMLQMKALVENVTAKKRKIDDVESDALVPLHEEKELVSSSDAPPSRKPPKRQPRDGPLSSDLITVVEFSMKLSPRAAKEKICMAKFPNILRTKVLSKWVAKYWKYKLWKLPLPVAEKLRQIPNWYVDQLGLTVQRKGRNTVAGIPIPVAKAVEQAQVWCEKCLQKIW